MRTKTGKIKRRLSESLKGCRYTTLTGNRVKVYTKTWKEKTLIDNTANIITVLEHGKFKYTVGEDVSKKQENGYYLMVSMDAFTYLINLINE